ncbi:ComEA family DNA-binding protein [Methylotenera sp.]|uniref:ComEA family DNA-binding protein n=1 Tax=Methylotenera sp. TaxID=2051956 RepID=UPI00351D6D03
MKIFLLALFLVLNLNLSALAAINLNTASQSELEEIKGIGPAKAKSILDYRKQHGDFKTINELENVKGIGEATVEKLRKQLFVIKHRKAANATKNNQASESAKTANHNVLKPNRPAKEPAATQ